MSSDWDEIKRLQADLQKVQLSTSLQRLSERNCIEVVSLLIEKGLLEIVFTNDGKEYLTPEQVTHEINDELFMNGGRVNLTELSKTINVDLSRITASANKIAYKSKKIHMILGQMINEDYIQRVAMEINERLMQAGELSVTQLAEQYDLPAEFIQQRIIDRNLGKIIQGKRDSSDPKVLFTPSYIARCKAKVRGALIGLTQPAAVASICGQCKLKESLFHSLFDELNADGTLTSRQTGAQYIPNAYKKQQNEFVASRFKQNRYIQHETVLQFGVSDPKAFIQRQLPNVEMVHLVNCTVAPQLLDQLEAAFEESLRSASYLDVATILPSDLSEEDVDMLMQRLLIAPASQRATLVLGTTILTNAFLEQLLKPCDALMTEKCEEAVTSGRYQQYALERLAASNARHQADDQDTKADRREERRKKAASGKAGGGAQGRETKTKSTKKHYRAGAQDRAGNDSDDNDDDGQAATHSKKQAKGKQQTLELISARDIVKVIASPLEAEGLEDLAKEIANHYYPQMNKDALTTAQTLYESTLQNTTQSRRKTHAALQDQLNGLVGDVRLYEKGLKLFPTDFQPQLVKYLLKSLGADICNDLCLYVAQECALNYSDEKQPLTADHRQRIVQECSHEYRASLQALNKSVSGQSVDEFLTCTENTLQVCSMILKKVDKKKDRTLIHNHKHGLLSQLNSEDSTDPALVLHLSVLIIFTVATQNMLHASGRHVSAILSFLQPHLQPDQSQLLTQYHDLVLSVLANNENAATAQEQLVELTPKIKEIASTYKRTATGNGD